GVHARLVSLHYAGQGDGCEQSEALASAVLRNLTHTPATPPPPPTSATAGTYNTIDRRVGGARLSGLLPIRGLGTPLRLSAGIDAQAMRDNRKNQRSSAGAPTGQLLADQRETVREIGPFAPLP